MSLNSFYYEEFYFIRFTINEILILTEHSLVPLFGYKNYHSKTLHLSLSLTEAQVISNPRFISRILTSFIQLTNFTSELLYNSHENLPNPILA